METSNALVQPDNPTDIALCEPNQLLFIAAQRLSSGVPSLPPKHLALAPTSAVEAWYTNSTGAR
jgi:hypothetical protein